MNRHQRLKLFEHQMRAFNEGTVEYINGQWVFFDRETEEASILDDLLHREIEVFRYNRWKKGILFEDGKIGLKDEIHYLKDQDLIRIRKNLIFALDQLLNEINDEAFIQFVTSLNSLQFSIYDCIYCYNHLDFLGDLARKSGVNFMVFDNQDQICAVQHHFFYYEKMNDRFEFTLNTGKRMVIEKYLPDTKG